MAYKFAWWHIIVAAIVAGFLTGYLRWQKDQNSLLGGRVAW